MTVFLSIQEEYNTFESSNLNVDETEIRRTSTPNAPTLNPRKKIENKKGSEDVSELLYSRDGHTAVKVVPVSIVKKVVQSELKKNLKELKRFCAENQVVRPMPEAGTIDDDIDTIPTVADEHCNVRNFHSIVYIR